MDTYTTLLTTGTTGTLLTVLVVLFKTFNGRKIHSKCCDKDIEIGIQVEQMTPVTNSLPQQFKDNPLVLGRGKNG